MALPKQTKKIVPDVGAAVKRAAESADSAHPAANQPKKAPGKGGRPSPRSGKSVRQTLLLSEITAERLTMAYAGEQIKRRKAGKKLDKSLLIEEMIINWLDTNGY